MKRMSPGIRLESFGLPLRPALQAAAALGVRGIQIDSVGDLAPDQLSQSGRRELRNLLKAHDLELTALGCPLRHGLDTAENQEARLERIRRVMTLSYDLGPGIVIVQAGKVPGPEEANARVDLLTEALTVLGQFGDRHGTVLALETGLDPGDRLRQYLDRFNTVGLGVNLDPANLLMQGLDPYESTRALGGKIVHAQAKDARVATASRAAQEVPLGHGDIDWMRQIACLEEVEYRGWLVIERETGARVAGEMEASVKFLRRFLGP